MDSYPPVYDDFLLAADNVFQGRYKALVVEPGDYLRNLIAYIDLNPVRAKVCELETLGQYPFGSYRFLLKPMARPRWLKLESCLQLNEGLSDDARGWEGYRCVLEYQVAKGPAGTSAAYEKMSAGWALGSEAFKAKLVVDHQIEQTTRAWEKSGAKEVARLRWQAELERLLAKLGKTKEDIVRDRKSAPWKTAVGVIMKSRCEAKNPWLAEALSMGTPTMVSQGACLVRKTPERYVGFLAQLTKD